jgi:hypothetical protein
MNAIEAIERQVIVASLSGRTLESLTIDNLIWPSALNYLGIKEDIMDIPGKIRVNVAIWYLGLVTGLFRIIITVVCLFLMTFTFIKCGFLPCLHNQDDIKGRVIAEFDEKCKLCHYITVIIS